MKENFWNKYASIYDRVMNKEADNSELFRFIKTYLKHDDIILDAACGTGLFTVNLSPYVKEVYCFDFASKMVEITEKKAEKLNLNNIHTSTQDITNLSYNLNQFDVAIAANIIHLLDNPEKAVKQLMYVTKDNGTIILPTYISGNYINKLKIKIMKIFGFRSNEWTSEEYLNLLESMDLNVVNYKIIKSGQPICVVIIKNL